MIPDPTEQTATKNRVSRFMLESRFSVVSAPALDNVDTVWPKVTFLLLSNFGRLGPECAFDTLSWLPREPVSLSRQSSTA